MNATAIKVLLTTLLLGHVSCANKSKKSDYILAKKMNANKEGLEKSRALALLLGTLIVKPKMDGLLLWGQRRNGHLEVVRDL